MKIDEAIKNLQRDLLLPGSVDKLDFQDSEQLGIEALNAWKRFRIGKTPTNLYLLPGETEE